MRSVDGRHGQRALRSVILAGTAFMGFRALEQGQHVGPRPSRVTGQRCPTVVIVRMAADVDHAVERTASTEHLASGPTDPPVVRVSLRCGVKRPVVWPAKQRGPALKGMDGRVGVDGPRLDDVNSVARVEQAPGYDASS